MAHEREAQDITDAVAVSHGNSDHALVLKSDGTVAAVGTNTEGQCDVGSWENIRAVFTDQNVSYGICEDGTVVAAGDPSWGMTYMRQKNLLEMFSFWISAWNWTTD